MCFNYVDQINKNMLLLQTIDIAYSPTITTQYLYFTIISSTLVKGTQLNSKFSINIFPITEVFSCM